MPKAGERDVAKEQQWRRIFATWKSTDLTGADYCRQNDLVYSQFNAWNKRLKKRDAEPAASPYRQRMARRARGIAENLERDKKARAAVEFAEVRVTEKAPGRSAPAVNAAPLEITFPSGVMLKVVAGCPLELVSSVLSLLEGR